MFNMPFQLSHPSIIESPDDADSADVNTLDVIPGEDLSQGWVAWQGGICAVQKCI